MKTKYQVQANWLAYCKQYAKDHNYDLKKELSHRDECANEMAWCLLGATEKDIDKRIDKYTRLLLNDKIGIDQYDPMMACRLDFLKWMNE